MLGADFCSVALYLLLSVGLDDLSVGAIDGGALDVNVSRVVAWCLSVLLSVSPFLVGLCVPEADLLLCVEGACGECDPLPSILSALLPPPSTFPSRVLTFGTFSPVAAVRRSDWPEVLEFDIAA